MAINKQTQQKWQDLQSKHASPVTALGVRIDPSDSRKMESWRSLGMDRFMKR